MHGNCGKAHADIKDVQVSVPTFRESLHVTGDCVEILLSVKDGPPPTSTKESLELGKNDVKKYISSAKQVSH